jgi:hypothetical protein
MRADRRCDAEGHADDEIIQDGFGMSTDFPYFFVVLAFMFVAPESPLVRAASKPVFHVLPSRLLLTRFYGPWGNPYAL